MQNPSKSIFDCLVIGAGHNGLTAAAKLAKEGKKVLIVEKNNAVGGLAASWEFFPGFKTAGILHDSSCVQPSVAHELQLEKFGLQFLEQEPSILALDPNGPGILLFPDAERSCEEIAAYSPHDAEQYKKYRQFFQRVKPFLQKVFTMPPPDVYSLNFYGLWDLMKKAVALRLLGKADMMELLRIGPMCVADWLNEWFKTDILKGHLAYPAVMGSFMGPWSPSSNANLLVHEALRERTVRGGAMALVSALHKACKHYGVDFILGRGVKKILLDQGRTCGVELDDGEKISTKTVAASCDPKTTFLKLLANDQLSPRFEKRVMHLRSRGCTAKINLAVNGILNFDRRPLWQGEQARVAVTLDYMEKSFDAIKYGEFSAEPTLDIYVPSTVQPELAPAGQSVVSILVSFAPYHLRGGWTAEQKEKLYFNTLKVLRAYSSSLENLIVGYEVLSPEDLERIFNVNEGHIHHGEHSADQILLRPTPECAHYKTPIAGLYVAGSGAHPGGGLTCLPGALAAQNIAADLR